MTQDNMAGLYRRLFQDNPDGVKVLEDLNRRFHDCQIWVEGGVDGSRETDYRLGKRDVIRYIFTRIGQVQDSPQTGTVSLSEPGDNSHD